MNARFSKPYVEVRHNFEAAHRLFLTPGKCQAIHGHSFWAELKVFGTSIDSSGLLDGIEFGDLKAVFRHYLDHNFDHHILLNERDPWAALLNIGPDEYERLPGLTPLPVDPTTENLAYMIAEYMGKQVARPVVVRIKETSVNSAGVLYDPA